MSELTQEHLNQGIEKLARILYDEFYSINASPDEFRLMHDNKQQILIKTRFISGQDLCLFASAIYNYLINIEKDQCVISALDCLIFGIDVRLKSGRDLPPGFFSAYRFIQELNSQSLIFNPEKLRSMSGLELDEAVRKLEEAKTDLRTGESVFIASVDTLARLGSQRGMADVFRYKGNFYCTDSPQTYGFKRDLETAMDMLK